MSSANVVFGNKQASLRVTYKPHKGERFAFLFLGAFPEDGEPDPDAVLKSLGWTPPAEPLDIPPDQEVDIETYLSNRRAEDNRCVADWRENQAKDPENWPAQLTIADWDEQFRVFFGG